MGCGGSKEFEDPAATARSRSIENQLKQEKAAMAKEVKMLLLGAGESGKSTVLKQMRLIHEGVYSDQERLAYKEIIFSNVIQSMRVLLDAMDMMGIAMGADSNTALADMILDLPIQLEGADLDPEIGHSIQVLWKDPGVQACFARSNEFQINDSAPYYFESIDRICSPTFVPTDQDVLRSRVKTTGITETAFTVGDLKYRVFDVGGQRSERKKWIHCFENVTAILFLVALSEFDQQLYEDETVNRMQESLVLFDSICNSRWFVRTSIILFLNKIDLFKAKLEKGSLVKTYFPDYEGRHEFEESAQFFKNKFVSLSTSENKTIYSHMTCATDTQQIKFILGAVQDTILRINLATTFQL